MRHAWERRENCTWFWWESVKERDHSDDRVVDGRVGIRMDRRQIGWGYVEWIQLAQHRGRRQAFVNTVMILQVLAPRNYLDMI
jgi:hypothetical protein